MREKLSSKGSDLMTFGYFCESIGIRLKEFCKSKMKPFQIGQGEYIKADDSTRIGQGGFGTIFKGKWHGENSAFKYLRIRNEPNKKTRYFVQDIVEKHHERLIEYYKQLDVSTNHNSGIIIPKAFYRQQLQVKDDNGHWKAENYDVYVYPRYDCNLLESHELHFNSFDKEITMNIMEQCFTRFVFEICIYFKNYHK